MARRSITERLAAEREKAAAAQERVRKLEAQARKTDAARRKRRDAILGELVAAELERDTDMSGRLLDWLQRELPGHLKRDSDRELMRDLSEGKGAGDGQETKLEQ